MRLLSIVLILWGLSLSGCLSTGETRGMDAGPTLAFQQWVKTVEDNDYVKMWEMWPITAKERFRYGWDDEKEQLRKSTVEMRNRFMKTYGFNDWSEVENEEAPDFFVRSMASYKGDKSFPRKYQLLKKATVHKIIYTDEGTACTVTFKNAEGKVLPMQMKMLREGDSWKVVGLP